MARRPRRPDLLPSHATPRERAIADTDGRLDDIDTALISTLKSPDIVPLAYLPALAWEKSVDVYRADWPEGVRRAAVAAAPFVHAHKGTAGAVKAGLAALRVDAAVTEWWQTTPRGTPYTFEVEAFARSRLYPDGPVLDLRLIQAVRDTIMRVKPTSRAFDLRIGILTEAGLGLAPVAAARPRVAAPAPAVLPMPPAESDLGLAPVAAARPRAALAAPALLPVPDAAAGLSIAAVAVARPRLSLLAIAELPA